MSIDLSIPVLGRLELAVLLRVARRELRCLLNYEGVPELAAVRLALGQRIPFDGVEIPNAAVLLVGLESDDCEVELLLLEDPLGGERGEPARSAEISVRGAAGDPKKSALAAALAIGIATMADSVIVDNYQIWVAQDELTPEEMRRILASPTPAGNLDDAAKEFVKRMSKPP